MKTQLTQTKINGLGNQQDHPRNLAHLLSRRFAILPDAPPAAPQPVNPTADQKPEPSSHPSPQLESTLCVNRQPGATLERVANLTPQPPSPCDTAGTNLKPKIGTLNTSARTRTGKIARLPLETREIVNGMLRAGFRYNDIVEYLKELGHPGITPGNITFWRHHGYIDWLNHQHELEAQAVFAKSIEHCIRSLDINHVQQSAIAFAADQLRQIMIQFNPRRALDLLNSRP